MQLKQFLLETFEFNSNTNKKVLEKLHHLDDREACIRLFSHLINSQYKWMARIMHDANAIQMDWWLPEYRLDDLEDQWNQSLQPWLDYINSKTEEELCTQIEFTGYDGGRWAATAKDIALQLNYHSIHHRAQMQSMIRQQGLQPDFVDYIGTKYRKLD